MGLIETFNAHPAATKQTYLEHLYETGLYCVMSLIASVAFFIHALFPFLLEDQGRAAVRWIMVNSAKTREDAAVNLNLKNLRDAAPPQPYEVRFSGGGGEE